MKRPLQVMLVVTGAIPLALGIMGIIGGGTGFIDEAEVTASLDSMLRFYAVWFTLAFFLAVWMARNIETCGPVLRITFTVMAVGGVARLISVAQYGLPEAPMLIGMAVEIATIGFIPWHRAVVGDGANAKPTPVPAG